MAYHIEKGTGDIVIDGFEAGIADAPEQGVSMMRNVNLISIPGEASVNFKTIAVNVPATGISAVACTLDTATHSVTWIASVALYTDTAVIFGTSAGGVTAGTVYWIASVSGNTFKIYNDIGHSSQVLVTDTANTFTVVTFGQATHKALDVVNNNIFILDLNGRAWWINASGNLTFLGNTTLTTTHGNGLCVLGDYLMVFRDTSIDYMPLTYLTSNAAPVWTYAWGGYVLDSSPSSNYSHYAIVAQDNGMYYCNGQKIGSVLIKGGSVFDPATAGTFTATLSALLLPATDRSTCLAELGETLLVGGILNKIYPWNRISTSFAYPVIISENYTTRMVTTNSTTYVFAGNRGRIYQTNGANIQLFKKIPDHITLDFGGSLDPYYTWLDAIYWKNQIYFSFLTAKNDGAVITNMGGLWGLDVSMNIMGNPTSVALRMTNTFANGAAAYPYVIIPNIRSTTPAGAGLYLAYQNKLDSSVGVEVTSTTPYTVTDIGGEIYTELIPTGTAIDPITFGQIEFKLSAALVAGEMVRISSRQAYSEGWTNIVGTTTTVGALSDNYKVNFQKGQWIQLYAELFSTATTPSYTRLKELRIKKIQ